MRTASPRSTRTVVDAAAFSVPRAGGAPDSNEDSVVYSVGTGKVGAWADFVAVVADGVGTSRDPAAASRAATQTWMESLERRFTERPDDLAGFDEAQFGQIMRECFAQAHRQVQRNAPGGSATAAGACVQGPWLMAATIGDARIYHFSEGRLRQITHDQIDAAGNPTDVLGGRAAAPNVAGYARPSLHPGDWIVACSDGLTKTLPAEELERLLKSSDSAQAVARILKQRVETGRIDDDVTAVVARVVGTGSPFWEQEAGSRERESGSEERGSDKEPVMRTSTDPSIVDIEARLSRLERAPNGGSLSQQEQARLEREFGRLEREMADVEARLLRASRISVAAVVVAVALALAAGLATGYLLRGGSLAAAGPKVAASVSVPLRFDPQLPDDLLVPLQDLPTPTELVLRYRSKDQHRKVAVYRYQDGGKPYVIYSVPEGAGRK